MAETKLVKSWGASCARQAIIAIFGFLFVVLAFITLVALSVSLPLTGDQRIYLLLGGFFFILLLAIAGIFIWANHQARRRATQLDSLFTPLGLTGKGYLWVGRQYHGIYRGRQVDVYLSRGPTLDIYLASTSKTRLGIGPKGRLSQVASTLIHRPELTTGDPGLAGLVIYPMDEAWARMFLEDERARAAIARLAQAGPGVEFRNLLFQPEALHLDVHRLDLDRLTQANVSAWIADLLELAGIAEALPVPSIPAEASPLERHMRLNRSEYILPMLGITCTVIGFFAALLIITFVVLFKIGTGG